MTFTSDPAESPANAGPAAAGNAAGGVDAEVLAKILANPEMAALLKTLAATMK